MRELSLLHLNGKKYGIWYKDFDTLMDVTSIHWLAPDSGYIAGMTVFAERTMALFDLSKCLGLPPLSRKRVTYTAVTLDYKEKKVAFLIEFSSGTLSVSEKKVCAIPAYLKTPILDTVVIQDVGFFEIIPVINISKLLEMVLQSGFQPYQPFFHIEGINDKKTGIKSVHFVTCAGGEFALSIDPREIIPRKCLKFAGLDLLPSFVAGITFKNGRIIPLVDLSGCMKVQGKGTSGVMLVTEIQGEIFGFLVDGESGRRDLEGMIVKPLPFLVQTDCSKDAITSSNSIVPIINPAKLLASLTGPDKKGFFAGKYVFESDFNRCLGKSDVNVLEFSLSGNFYAVPKSEVENTFPLSPFRPLPGTVPIVAGIADHDGELLPVIDIAVCYGRYSLVTGAFQMILIKNGSFRALVLAEKIVGNRLLSVSEQHHLPFDDSLGLVYGCYPEKSAVNLILNIAAIAVNYEKANFSKFREAFSHDNRAVSVASEDHEETAFETDFHPADIQELTVSDSPETGSTSKDGPFNKALFNKLSDAFDLHTNQIAESESEEFDLKEIPENPNEKENESLFGFLSGSDVEKIALKNFEEGLSPIDDPDVMKINNLNDYDEIPIAIEDEVTEIKATEPDSKNLADIMLVGHDSESDFLGETYEEINSDAAPVEGDENSEIIELTELVSDDNSLADGEEIVFKENGKNETPACINMDTDSGSGFNDREIGNEAPEEPVVLTEQGFFSYENELPSDSKHDGVTKTSHNKDTSVESEPKMELEPKNTIVPEASQEETVSGREESTGIENDDNFVIGVPEYVCQKRSNKFKYIIPIFLLFLAFILLSYNFMQGESKTLQTKKRYSKKITLSDNKLAVPSAVKSEKIIYHSDFKDKTGNSSYGSKTVEKNTRSGPGKKSSGVADQNKPESGSIMNLNLKGSMETDSQIFPGLKQTEYHLSPISGDWVVYSVQKGDNLWTISKRITGKGINYHWIADDNNIFNPDLIYPNRK